jgi:hypothetical protein
VNCARKAAQPYPLAFSDSSSREFRVPRSSKTFAQHLDDNGMGALTGYLMYAYQVQGYGDLDKIPAYYDLVWITPDMATPFGTTSGVTAWQKGWEDVWDQMDRSPPDDTSVVADPLVPDRGPRASGAAAHRGRGHAPQDATAASTERHELARCSADAHCVRVAASLSAPERGAVISGCCFGVRRHA